MKLPSGPGAPAADIPAALADATAACRRISTYSADIAASGSVGGQRLRGHLLVGVAAPASARLEAVAPVGQPLFIFVTSAAEATLLLPRDNRVLEHGRPADVLEAIAGVPLDAAGLRTTLTGCAAAADRDTGRSLGDDWRVASDGDADVYLHRLQEPDRWRLVAAVHRRGGATGEWRAEYADFDAGLPRTVHLASADRRRFDLTLKLSQVALDEPMGANVFRVRVPADADPITIDELRHARPGLRQN